MRSGKSLRTKVFTSCLLAATCIQVGSARGQTAPSQAGGFTSDNVRWVRTVPIFGTGTWMPGAPAGWTNSGSGRVANGHLFVWAEGVTIYDIADPLNPRLVSYLPRPGPWWFPQGTVSAWSHLGRFDTNGEILVMPAYDRDGPGSYDPSAVTNAYAALYVYDVTDPANPEEIGKLSRLPSLFFGGKTTISGPFCVLDCKWLYDRWGAIIDLRDPSRPRLLRKRWTRNLKFNNTAQGLPGATEMVEVAPGKLLLGAHPMYLLDVTRPAHPKVIARSDGSPHSRGDVAWPRFPHGDVLVSTNIGETGTPRCEMTQNDNGTSAQSVFSSWVADDWQKTGYISRADDYRLRNGTYTDGDPAFSGVEGVGVQGLGGYGYDNGCAFKVFDVRPTRDNIEVAVAAHGHGLKLFGIAADGKIELEGWFLGHGANAINVLWANRRVVYALDANRGIDVLKVDK